MSQVRRRLKAATAAFTSNAVNRNLRRAQLSYLAAWTAEWAFTVAAASRSAYRPARGWIRSELLRPLEQPLQDVSIVLVDGSQLVALMEGELRGSTQARHGNSVQLTHSEAGRREDVKAAAEGCLTNSPVLVK